MFRQKVHSLFSGNNRRASHGRARHHGRMGMEEHFRSMLEMERKRMQQCNTPFMLMFVDVADLLQCKNTRKTFKNLLTAIENSTRDTDMKGWYEANRIIGIIFTEFDIETADLIVNKVRASIAETLIPAMGSMVQVSFLLFPEDHPCNKRCDTEPVIYRTPADAAVFRKQNSLSHDCKNYYAVKKEEPIAL
jgi:hypothetical protein